MVSSMRKTLLWVGISLVATLNLDMRKQRGKKHAAYTEKCGVKPSLLRQGGTGQASLLSLP